MNYLTYLPVFDKLTKSQQDTLTSSSFVRKFGKGELLHNGSQNCTGLLLVLSSQIRAFTISDDGREITMYRLFERDICLFSASCIMNISDHLFLSIEKARSARIGLGLAEKQGFEPWLRFTRTTPLAGEPLRPLGYFSTAEICDKRFCQPAYNTIRRGRCQ